jgi:hypothetical protein
MIFARILQDVSINIYIHICVCMHTKNTAFLAGKPAMAIIADLPTRPRLGSTNLPQGLHKRSILGKKAIT